MKTKKLLVIILLIIVACNSNAQGSWIQKTNFGGTARFAPTGFSIGSKGYIGLGTDSYPNYNFRSDFWEYDTATNAWTQKADFAGVARYSTAQFVIGTKAYVGMGWDHSNYFNDFWEYDQTTNIWTQRASLTIINRTSPIGFSIGNKGYIGLGLSDYYGMMNDFWEYDPTTDVWTQRANFGGTGRAAAISFVIDSIAYVGSGTDGYPNINVVSDFWKYDVTTNAWTQIANFPSPRQEMATFTINHKGYVGTGADNNYNGINDFFEYNPGTNQWTQIASYPGPNGTHCAMGFSIGNTGFVGTGAMDLSALTNQFWAFYVSPNCNLSVTSQTTSAMCSTCTNGWAVAIPSGGTAPYSYTWTTTPIQTTQSANGLLPGTYTVNVTDSNNCSASSIVTIGNANVCGASYLLYPDTNVAHTYYIVNQSWGVNPIHYDWNWGDSTTHDTTLYPSHTYATAGYYNICLTITDAVGCSSTYCYNYYLMRGKNSMINVIVISPTTGSNQIKKNDYCALFPNPNNGNFTLNYHQSSNNCELQLIDLSGRVVYKQTFTELEGSQTINVSNLDNGIYYWKMVSDNVILSKGKMTILK
ncbi:MAG: kelch repeat-containing protein [Bacteroidota bacterium]